MCQLYFTARCEREEHQGGGAYASLFSAKSFQLIRDGLQKGRGAKKVAALSQTQSYRKLHNNVRLDKTLSVLWAEPLKIPIPAEAEEGKNHM